MVNGTKIKQGNIMGLNEKEILSVSENVSEATSKLIDEMLDDDSDFVSLYYGDEVSEEEAEELLEQIEKEFPDIEFELNYGGQPIYYYYISIE